MPTGRGTEAILPADACATPGVIRQRPATSSSRPAPCPTRSVPDQVWWSKCNYLLAKTTLTRKLTVTYLDRFCYPVVVIFPGHQQQRGSHKPRPDVHFVACQYPYHPE